MTTTARQATRRIADTAALVELVVFSADGCDRCESCDQPADYLFCRYDESGSEVRVCEDCVNCGFFGFADCD